MVGSGLNQLCVVLQIRATPDLPDPSDPLAKRDPKETVVIPDLLVAPVRWAPLEPQEFPERRVAPAPMVPL